MRKFLIKTLNGMTYGLFATLIIGVIFQQFGKLLGISLFEVELYNLLSSLMGLGIGLGIGIVLEKKGLNLILVGVSGAIATAFHTNLTFEPFYTNLTFEPFQANVLSVLGPGNPVTAYFVVIFTIIIADLILRGKTPIDIVLIPLTMIILSLGITLLISYPLNQIVEFISKAIDTATNFSPILMSIIIAVLMGMLLTSPISSAAISFAVGLNGIAAGAAVVGTSIQMLGFAVQSIRDNKVGEVISVAIGTSMLQFKNIVKNPYIWLPTILSSAIISPIVVGLFNFESTTAGAGMGTSGLVGILQSLDKMNYSGKVFISIGIIVVIGSLLVYIFDLILRKMNLINKGDFFIGEGI